MGEAIPLKYFQLGDGGLKLFIDKDCSMEETVDETNTIQKVYKLVIPNVIRGKKKFTTRYIKNTGYDQLLYVIFPVEETNVKVTFKLGDMPLEGDFANGVLLPEGSHQLNIYVETPKMGDTPVLYLGLASRPVLD